MSRCRSQQHPTYLVDRMPSSRFELTRLLDELRERLRRQQYLVERYSAEWMFDEAKACAKVVTTLSKEVRQLERLLYPRGQSTGLRKLRADIDRTYLYYLVRGFYGK